VGWGQLETINGFRIGHNIFRSMFLLVAVCIVLGVVCLSVCFVGFDRYIRTMYTYRRDEWEGIGRPVGFFWQPSCKEDRRSASYLAREDAVDLFLRSGTDEGSRMLFFRRLANVFFTFSLFIVGIELFVFFS